MRSIRQLNGIFTSNLVSIRNGRSWAVALSLLPVVLALSLPLFANGAEMGPVPEDHPKPRIAKVDVYFDGIDQYAIFGTVTDCTELDGITVTLGGILGGATELTDYNGNFQYLGICSDGSGLEVAISATCPAGKKSDEYYIRLP